MHSYLPEAQEQSLLVVRLSLEDSAVLTDHQWQHLSLLRMVFHCLLTVVLMWMQEQLCLYSGLLWVLYTWRMLLELRIQELQLSMSDLRKKREIHLSKKHIQCLKSVLTLTL